jgi:ATP-binding cassette subfamily B protein
VEEIPTQIGEIFETIQSSIGEKFSNLLFAGSCCVGGIGFAFYRGPMFAGICMAYVPVFLAILIIFGRRVQSATMGKLDTVKGLGGIAEEILTAIKVVISFGREEKEIEKFY